MRNPFLDRSTEVPSNTLNGAGIPAPFNVKRKLHLEAERSPEANVARELPPVRHAIERVQNHIRVGNRLLRAVPSLSRLVEKRSATNRNVVW